MLNRSLEKNLHLGFAISLAILAIVAALIFRNFLRQVRSADQGRIPKRWWENSIRCW